MSAASPRIQAAIEGAYAQAGLPGPGQGGAIVPLDVLIAEQSLLRAEVPGLTRARAMAWLRRRASADLPELPDGNEDLAGFLYAFPCQGEVWGCLLVRQEDIIERRRFSAAHELGHYLLHFRPLLQERLREGQHLFLSEGFSFEEQKDQDPEDALPGAAALCAQDATGATLDALQAGAPRYEAEANRFAAELLMPEAICRALWQRPHGLRTPRRLAQELLVSPAAMQVRLGGLGLLD